MKGLLIRGCTAGRLGELHKSRFCPYFAVLKATPGVGSRRQRQSSSDLRRVTFDDPRPEIHVISTLCVLPQFGPVFCEICDRVSKGVNQRGSTTQRPIRISSSFPPKQRANSALSPVKKITFSEFCLITFVAKLPVPIFHFFFYSDLLEGIYKWTAVAKRQTANKIFRSQGFTKE